MYNCISLSVDIKGSCHEAEKLNVLGESAEPSPLLVLSAVYRKSVLIIMKDHK